jgi:hypothetical protein
MGQYLLLPPVVPLPEDEGVWLPGGEPQGEHLLYVRWMGQYLLLPAVVSLPEDEGVWLPGSELQGDHLLHIRRMGQYLHKNRKALLERPTKFTNIFLLDRRRE